LLLTNVLAMTTTNRMIAAALPKPARYSPNPT
jgi:hypothetical protein